MMISHARPRPSELRLCSLAQDQRVATDDLLYLLSQFGREAPARLCGTSNPPPVSDLTGINTVEEARELRSYLFCALRDRFFGEAARIQNVFDQQMEICNTTVAQQEQSLIMSALEAQASQFAHLDATAALQAIIANLTTANLALEQRMRTLHCAVPSIPHSRIVAGDAVYGGDGIRVECNPGYDDPGTLPLQGLHSYCTVKPSGDAQARCRLSALSVLVMESWKRDLMVCRTARS